MVDQKTYPITGIKVGLKASPGLDDKVPLRREIDEWWFSTNLNDDMQRSLFVFALQTFQDMPPQSVLNGQNNAFHDLSYFGIAGIHGLPLINWDMKTNKAKDGYCSHEDVMFPIWHRPYLLLYEQRIYEIMCDLIKEGTLCDDKNKQKWQDAADAWRLPYWDWAMKKPKWNPANPKDPHHTEAVENGNPNSPFCLTQKVVEVLTKDGLKSVRNPMWRYSLPVSLDEHATKNGNDNSATNFGFYGVGDLPGKDKDNKDITKLFSEARATCRHPTAAQKHEDGYEKAWIHADEMNSDKISAQLAGHDELPNTLPESVYRLFCYARDYEEFATHKYSKEQPTKAYSSIEDVHNVIHWYAGERGQMGTVAVAAFDPIFWLHHCNIDRLFAIWQQYNRLEYDEWLAKTERANEALNPFHKDTKGTPYTPLDCSYPHQQLGYTYPELQTWRDEYKSGDLFNSYKLRADIKKNIELKYSTTGKNGLQLPGKEDICVAHMSTLKPENLKTEYVSESCRKMAEQVKNGQLEVKVAPPKKWETPDYVVNVKYNSFELEGRPFCIRLFMGDVPDDVSASFSDCKTAISLIYNFSSMPGDRGISSEGCHGCKERQSQGVMSSGQIILTDYLINYIKRKETQEDLVLGTLDTKEVTQYLKKNLHWRVTDQSNALVPMVKMPSLKISVAKGSGTHYADADKFSNYGNYEILWEVTKDRPGGAKEGDQLFASTT